MPILLVLFVTAACLPVPWPEPPLGLGAAGAAGFAAVVVAASLAAATALRTWAVRALRRDPNARTRVGRVYGRLRRLLGLVNLGLVGYAVVGLGWGWAVQNTLTVEHDGWEVLAPFAELAVPLPYFVLLAAGWVVYYDAEKALHAGARGFPTRVGYVLGHARFLGFLLALPLALYAGIQAVGRFAPGVAGADAFRLASLAVLPVLAMTMPLLAKPLLGLKRLPDGHTRERLEALARRLRFTYTDLLLWPTHGTMANAFIAGLLPRARYVVFTDRILDDFPPDEVDAIFGHEVGHQRHGHLWLYAAFFLLSVVDLTALAVWAQPKLAGWVGRTAAADPWWVMVPTAGLAAYLFLVFGFLSRRCERQADVFGCRSVSCDDPACEGHVPDTDFPAGGAGLCPTGIRTFVRALERVDLLGGSDDPAPDRPAARLLRGAVGWLRAWQHGPVKRRVAFLLTLVDDPRRERGFRRRTVALRAALMAALVALLVVLGEAVGWRVLLSAL
ncbi:MAG: M48 family metallopeptidase [Gemmataceae bacterium]